MPETKKCSSGCKKLRCGQSALQFRGRNSWCRWTDEPCNPASCSYAMCITRRLLPNGVCGETVRRKTIEKKPEDDTIHSIRVRGKVYRKIGEKEIF
ncbi:MAG: hypothetical protein NWF14_05980 [Candidatus Bathyarchaeota archaeon]|nr:hypothetical protein [Candidatus Bathyarchaeota archaeon]